MTHKPASWKFDRNVPLALVATLLMQLAAGLVWATHLEARVGGLEERYPDNAALAERFARLEERMDGIKDDMQAVKQRMDMLLERLVRK